MGNYTILSMFENPRRGRQARNFTTNAPKTLDLKSSSEQIFSRKLPLGAPEKNRDPFCNLRISKDFIKKRFTLLKTCVLSFLCGLLVDLIPFYRFLLVS